MRFSVWIAISFLSVSILSGCKQSKEDKLFDKSNLIAWCIVPFDSVQRGPEARAQMLDELGFSKFAWDWRPGHVPMLAEEIDVLQAHNIELAAVWFWIDGSSGRLIDESLQAILRTLKEKNVKTEFWVSFHEKYFENLAGQELMTRAVTMVGVVRRMAQEIGCTISLYNHGGWFGDPRNQVKIIEALKFDDVGIVYNFHHGHEQMDEFPGLLEMMMPYLRTVNINGMKAGGSKILPVGEGDREREMLRVLKDSGFKGTIGILGHTEGEDVKTVLGRNLDGLKKIRESL